MKLIPLVFVLLCVASTWSMPIDSTKDDAIMDKALEEELTKDAKKGDRTSQPIVPPEDLPVIERLDEEEHETKDEPEKKDRSSIRFPARPDLIPRPPGFGEVVPPVGGSQTNTQILSGAGLQKNIQIQGRADGDLKDDMPEEPKFKEDEQHKKDGKTIEDKAVEVVPELKSDEDVPEDKAAEKKSEDKAEKEDMMPEKEKRSQPPLPLSSQTSTQVQAGPGRQSNFQAQAGSGTQSNVQVQGVDRAVFVPAGQQTSTQLLTGPGRQSNNQFQSGVGGIQGNFQAQSGFGGTQTNNQVQGVDRAVFVPAGQQTSNQLLTGPGRQSNNQLQSGVGGIQNNFQAQSGFGGTQTNNQVQGSAFLRSDDAMPVA